MKQSNVNTLKALILGTACVAFLTLAQVSGSTLLIYMALVGYLATLLISNDEHVIPMFLFYLPWSPILKPSPTSIAFSSVGTILVFFVFILKSQKIRANTIFSAIAIVIITMIAKLVNNYDIATSLVMFVLMLVAIPFIVRTVGTRIKFDQCAIFFALGIILATIASAAFGSNHNMIEYVKVMSDDKAGVTRLCGFYGDPNFYSAQIVAAAGCLLALIARKKKGILIYSILVVALIFCGFTAVSKSFIICMLAVVALWLFALFKENKARFSKVGIALLVILAVVTVSGLVFEPVQQFVLRFGTASNANELSTGRFQLWEEYMTFLLDNPLDLLIGQGYTSVFKGVRKGSHNTPIQALYQLGALGIIILLMWIRSFSVKERKGTRSAFYVFFLVVSCFSMWMGLDMLFFDDFFLVIALFFEGINSPEFMSHKKKHLDMMRFKEEEKSA